MAKKQKKSEARIELNKRFYDVKSVKESANDFKGVCSCKINVKGGRINVKLIPKNAIDSNVLCLEFCNYVLALMKGKALV